MIPPDIHAEIMKRIYAAEREHNVKVLYAVESGSRAWGFASPNSDYDVRFIYVHPRDWYLTIDLEDKRDVIEYPIVDEIDINGWDLRKALQLLWRSNPGIVEWLQSPIIYIDDGVFAPAVRSLLADVYSPLRGIYHYRSMAKNNYREHLKKDLVTLKKYFYALRSLVSMMWIEKFESPAPIEFHLLRELLTEYPDVNAEIDVLLERKKQAQEKEMSPAIPLLNGFIEAMLERYESLDLNQEDRQRNIEPLSALFQSYL